MTKDFTRTMRCSNGMEVTVLYHYEYAMTEAVVVIDHVWDENQEYDVDVSQDERIRLADVIMASYVYEDLP